MINKEMLNSYTEIGNYKRISKDFEKNLPRFFSYDEAYKYLRNLFGSALVSQGSFREGERICRNYLVIHNRDVWEKGRRSVQKVSGLEFILSAQNILIYDDGEVHVAV